MPRKEEKVFFSEEKKQKTFTNLADAIQKGPQPS
jgi:hypothetical protein